MTLKKQQKERKERNSVCTANCEVCDTNTKRRELIYKRNAENGNKTINGGNIPHVYSLVKIAVVRYSFFCRVVAFISFGFILFPFFSFSKYLFIKLSTNTQKLSKITNIQIQLGCVHFRLEPPTTANPVYSELLKYSNCKRRKWVQERQTARAKRANKAGGHKNRESERESRWNSGSKEKIWFTISKYEKEPKTNENKKKSEHTQRKI